ncbi:MAG: BACON domain-containing protein [Alistipes sp.]|nr:BACON domain-containing protein [Alistipes sp.]
MKRIFTFFTIALLAFAACEPVDNQEGGDNTNGIMPGVKVNKTEMTIGSGSVMSYVTYELINPTEGMTLVATADVDWISEFDYKDMGKVKFKAEFNPMAESRVGVITLTYGESSATVTITQEGNPEPTNIFIDAPILTGHYYGSSPYWNGLYNLYLAFSDKGFSSCEAIKEHVYANMPNAYYYLVDLYIDESTHDANNPFKVPIGTYDLDKASQGWPNMFGHVYSWLQYNDAEGFSSSQTKFDEGKLIVEEGKVTLDVTMTIDGIEQNHVVVYKGDYSLIDMTGISYI